VDRFPRNLAQRREFEKAVSMLANKLGAGLCSTTLCPNIASRLQCFYL
jgi:hypothetical protein